jgi:hypothetical protein
MVEYSVSSQMAPCSLYCALFPFIVHYF